MAKFVGYIGYATTEETSPGVWTDTITEKKYIGDVMWNNRRYLNGESVNDDVSLNQAVSVLADEYANQNMMFIRYVRWNGMYWKVSSVEVEPPRMKVYIGSVYNGPTAS